MNKNHTSSFLIQTFPNINTSLPVTWKYHFSLQPRHVFVSFLLLPLRGWLLDGVHQNDHEGYLGCQGQQHDIFVRRLAIILDIPDSLDAHSQNLKPKDELEGQKLHLWNKFWVREQSHNEGRKQETENEQYFLESIPIESICQTPWEDDEDGCDHPHQEWLKFYLC